jgi:oxygen-dependent protoporphyrinogen oxidase
VKVAIIGGGVAGLAAAYRLRRAADAGADVEFTLYEKDSRVGGKVVSEIVDDVWGGEPGARFVLDGGPDCFLTEKPAVHRIARLLGFIEDELPTDDTRKKTLILSRGGLYELPDGVMMFAPTKFLPFATTRLFSWPGKLRMGMDLFIGRKKVEAGELNDETLESFVVRRMGRECLDRLAEPLVGGVHASDPAAMSLAATFPRLLEMEQAHGSLVRGFLASRRKIEKMKRQSPVQGRPKTFFTSLIRGMGELPAKMAEGAGAANIVTGAAVVRLERMGDGSFALGLDDGTEAQADAVIVATESWAASPLMRDVEPTIAEKLAEIPSSSSATVSIAFREADIGIDMDVFGVLCPMVEGRALLAATYSSTKWPGRAPKGKVLFRGFLGGPHNQAIMDEDDDELGRIALSEMRDILGIPQSAEPLFVKVFRWHLAMPQYTMGHLGRVEEIERRSGEIKGLALAGGSYRGVGVPNCIESGERAADKVLGDFGIEPPAAE